MSRAQSLHHLFFEKDPDNSMLRSDILESKDHFDSQVIIEKDEEDGGEVIKENQDYRLVKS